MKIERTVTFTLTEAELECAYREREAQYRLLDAQNQLFYYLGIEDLSEEDASKAFEGEYGFPLCEACNPSSPNYLLDEIVTEFEDKFDCNIAENSVFEGAVTTVLNRKRLEATA